MSDDPDAAERRTLSAIVGAPVATFKRATWGFENLTDLVTLEDGRRLVVQRIVDRSQARRKLRLMGILPARLAAVGIRSPRLLGGDAQAAPPYLIREYLSGAPGPALLIAAPEQMASQMGAMLRQLARVATAGARLPTTWADSARLARAARRQLARCHALLDEPTRHALAATIEALPARFAGRAPCFAHGDFCPVNTLVEDGRVSALLDLESARLADPLFDVAWWGWVVRYHHADRWALIWPRLLASADITPDRATLDRIAALQRLRCLELLDQTRRFDRAAAEQWAQRLAQTVDW